MVRASLKAENKRRRRSILVVGGGGDVAREFYEPFGLFRLAKKYGIRMACVDPKAVTQFPKELAGRYDEIYVPGATSLERRAWGTVVIASPSASHFHWVAWAVANGAKSIFIEKPIVAPKDLGALERLRRSLHVASHRSRIFGLDWVMGNPAYQDAQPYLHQIGPLTEIDGILVERATVEPNRLELLTPAEQGGGIHQDMASHVLFFALDALERIGQSVQPENVRVDRVEFKKLEHSSRLGPGETAARTVYEAQTPTAVRIRSWCAKGVDRSAYVLMARGRRGVITITLGQHDAKIPPALTVRKGKKTIRRHYLNRQRVPDIGYKYLIRQIVRATIAAPTKLDVEREREVDAMVKTVSLLYEASQRYGRLMTTKAMPQYRLGERLWNDLPLRF